METVLKFDKVILTKELNEKFKKVGEVFEVANILDGGFLLRETGSKIAVGVINFEDFEKNFVKYGELNGWTPWTPIVGLDGQTDVVYRTNHKKVQVRFLKDKVRAEASCNPLDDFNLFFGIDIAYIRCRNKVLLRRKAAYEEALNAINTEIVDNNKTIKNMLSKLRV